MGNWLNYCYANMMSETFSFNMALLHNIGSLCAPDWGDGATGATLIGIMAMAGLVGSLSHCGPMCGIFVLAQVEKRLTLIPAHAMCESRRVMGAALPWYHLGRVLGYATLGASAAWIGGTLTALPGLTWLAALLLALAALGFSLQGLRRLLPGLIPGGADDGNNRWSTMIGRLAAPLMGTGPVNGIGLGMVLSLLPCGLLYAALAAAAASGRPLAGAFAMAAFAAGTIPGLVLVGIFGHLAGWRFRQWQQRAGPYLLLFNALLLGGLAVRVVS